MNAKLSVLDFFCGAGGFSEGFRQKGFEIVAGYDNWRPAVDTFSHNFGEGKGTLVNILELKRNIELIEALPDVDVIVGSPPCVSFSNSNKSGKADKSMGIQLTKAFLKIVAIKKYKHGSILKAWFMENVVKSIEYTAKDYSFNQLGLKKWAKKNGYDPKEKAISLKDNYFIMNSADYGSPQHRIRAIAGEMIALKRLSKPARTHKAANEIIDLPEHITLGFIRNGLPPVNSNLIDRKVKDPLYPEIQIDLSELTDQFYDTGLYKCEWDNSKFQKINHPYMGRMSFPENESKPSRTITATNIGTSREAIIYESEYNRKGDGQYRTPTVRESAVIMSFPITYQFCGSEGAKCRLVGNAVCPSISRALAIEVRKMLGLQPLTAFIVSRTSNRTDDDLNDFKPVEFNSPPIKKPGARFRRHPFKDGNITVTLSNYPVVKKKALRSGWLTSIQYGNGDGFPCQYFPDNYFKHLEPIIRQMDKGEKFIEIINNGFSEQIAGSELFQEMYERNKGQDGFTEPTVLIEKVASMINEITFTDPHLSLINKNIFSKEIVPKKQVMALYAINKICSVINGD